MIRCVRLSERKDSNSAHIHSFHSELVSLFSSIIPRPHLYQSLLATPHLLRDQVKHHAANRAHLVDRAREAYAAKLVAEKADSIAGGARELTFQLLFGPAGDYKAAR